MDTKIIVEFLKQASDIMNENRDYLIELDSVVGDSDLGLTMGDGFKAAYEVVKSINELDAGKVLYMAGKKMANAVPSTMGTLMASGLMQSGKVLKGKTELNEGDLIKLFEAYAEGVEKRGGAKRGDKTFLDGLLPGIDAMKASVEKGDSLKQAAINASSASKLGFENTTTMIAVHGRAATRGEESRKLLDPGAAVAMLLMEAFRKTVEYIYG